MISIIVPVLNEQEYIVPFTNQLLKLKGEYEFIFVDGGSTDQTAKTIKNQGFDCLDSDQGRAKQMNFGAKQAKGNYLLFLHVDLTFPINFNEVLQQLITIETSFANFKLAFDYSHWFLKINAVFSHLSFTPFQFGDQGLWVAKELFEKVNGFNESMVLLEDQDIVKRLKVYTPLQKTNAKLTVSSRKYLKYGIFKLQFIYFYIYTQYRLGKSQSQLKSKMEYLLRTN